MKYPPHRYQTEEDKYLDAIRFHTEEAIKFEGFAAKCHNPRIKADYAHSGRCSREAAAREQQNLEQWRLKQAGIPVQAQLEMAS